jgi:hypothetical protein
VAKKKSKVVRSLDKAEISSEIKVSFSVIDHKTQKQDKKSFTFYLN